ncbi:hypothetical protein CaCOL14_011620 [Colletotrichum acutatum]|uniref:Uncharacterized protein n=1 Tax=Glomerella acutata TaxID=27357 RepID=A0AAD8UKR0_GLOAC|nr:uncharacterized protein BDZ83DRAFT_621062 [Colletotrichum acutatum]KAK1725073.1 hypothetical protein BDZ83DRAFT_621062 [Colletotrichum acutatum]
MAAPVSTVFAHQPAVEQQALRPELRIRRYGRKDYKLFDQDTARGSHLCVGFGAIGKVQVECKYHWKKAQWGVLGSNRNPAGIVYLDISIKQPPGHNLRDARVLITLAEQDSYGAEAGRRWSQKHVRTSLDSDYAVQVTEHFGPQSLIGPQTVTSELKQKAFEPTLGAGGFFEIGGMGTRRSVARRIIDSWTFKGMVKRAKHGEGFRSLEWELKENETDCNPFRQHIFHTGFAFEHSGRPVTMCVEVEGRLKSRMRQGKHKFSKFCTRSSDTDNTTTTRIDLSSAKSAFKKQLDGIAHGLNMAMQKENYETVPVEMPAPMSATFEQISQPTEIPSQEFDVVKNVAVDILNQYSHQQLTSAGINRQRSPAESGSVFSSDDTLVNDSSDQNSVDAPPKPVRFGTAQNSLKVSEVVALALFKWLFMLLKLVGSNQYSQLAAMPISSKGTQASQKYPGDSGSRQTWDVEDEEQSAKVQAKSRPPRAAFVSDELP